MLSNLKAWQLTAQSGPAALRLVETETPKPARGQVLVRVRANSLNYRDLMVADGRYGILPLPQVPLSDGAGDIVELGQDANRWKVGDRVAATFFQGWPDGPFSRAVLDSALGGALPGMLSDYVALSEKGLVAIPSHLTYEEAATLPCAALTAWHALITRGRLSAADTVLLIGTGGVSIFALQFAKIHGARVILLSGSDEKLETARALGADHLINYKSTPDWEKEVFRLTGRAGADHIVEVGGRETFPKSVRAVAAGGTISLVGGVSGFASEIPIVEIISRMALVQGIYVGNRAMFHAMNRAITLHQLRPAISQRFLFDEAPEAYRCLQSGKHFGKIVILNP